VKKILVIGPNPAWQKVLLFENFRPGKINRARERIYFASGKAINFCRALHCHRPEQECRLFQFAGGESGDKVTAELDREKIPHTTVAIAGSTRICTTCCCGASGAITELIEPAAAVGKENVAELLADFARHLPEAGLVAFCGTLPPGAENFLYVEAARLTAKYRIPLLIDSYMELETLLSLHPAPMLKINADELRLFTGETETVPALRKLFARFPLRFAAITDGAGDALLCDDRHLHRYHLPKLERIVNSIGCGDTANAVLSAELLAGAAPVDAFAEALAAATANCLSVRCGEFDPADRAKFRGLIQIETQIL